MTGTASAHRVAAARTFLFVPGDRPDRFAKAAASGADVVVLDLEDAVATAHKELARSAVVAWLENGHDAVVRVNAAATPWYPDDVAATAGLALAVMVPKAESPADWAAVGTVPVIPLVETARGLTRLASLLEPDQVVRPAFGSVDLSVELGVDPDDHQALLYARSTLVAAAAAAGAAAPVDGVTVAVNDAEALARDVVAARRLGFTAKLCIHPTQVGAVHDLLRPTDAEAAWARRVVATASDGVLTVDGRMVDAPVLRRAHQVLARLQHAADT